MLGVSCGVQRGRLEQMWVLERNGLTQPRETRPAVPPRDALSP